MKNLHIMIRMHSDYDEHTSEVVGVTSRSAVAHAFLQAGMFDRYWSHEVGIVTLDVLEDHPDVTKALREWLDPAANPLCECGHRFLHHRRKDHAGSCKHNTCRGYEGEPHKCGGFKAAKEQPAPAKESAPEADKLVGKAREKAFDVTWGPDHGRAAGYYVSIPRYGGGKVVRLEDVEKLLRKAVQ